MVFSEEKSIINNVVKDYKKVEIELEEIDCGERTLISIYSDKHEPLSWIESNHSIVYITSSIKEMGLMNSNVKIMNSTN